jgi:hypothetical protein
MPMLALFTHVSSAPNSSTAPLRQQLHRLIVGDVAGQVRRATTALTDVLNGVLQRLLRCGEFSTTRAPREAAISAVVRPDPARCAGDHDDMVAQPLEFHRMHTSAPREARQELLAAERCNHIATISVVRGCAHHVSDESTVEIARAEYRTPFPMPRRAAAVVAVPRGIDGCTSWPNSARRKSETAWPH